MGVLEILAVVSFSYLPVIGSEMHISHWEAYTMDVILSSILSLDNPPANPPALLCPAP